MSRRILAIGALALSLVAADAAEISYSVRVDSGINPRMKAEEVAQLAVARLSKQVEDIEVGQGGETKLVPEAPEILEIRCTTLDKFIEMFDIETGEVDRRPVWFVRAKGDFTNYRVSPDKPFAVHPSGYFVFDDETGKVIAMGSNEPPSRTVPRPDDEDQSSEGE